MAEMNGFIIVVKVETKLKSKRISVTTIAGKIIDRKLLRNYRLILRSFKRGFKKIWNFCFSDGKVVLPIKDF